MNKEQRIKRNAAIKEAYEIETGEQYEPGKPKSGSSFVIRQIARKHKLTESAIYMILKQD